MTEHRLDPLLKPASIALLGASERAAAPGQILARMVIESDYQGEIYPVNPGYSKILRPTLLSRSSSLAANGRARRHCARQSPSRSCTARRHRARCEGGDHLFQRRTRSGFRATVEAAPEPTWRRRRAFRSAVINGMGFYNLEQQLYVGIFRARRRSSAAASADRAVRLRLYRALPQRLPARLQPVRIRRRRNEHHRGRLHGLESRSSRYPRHRPVPRNRARSAWHLSPPLQKARMQ